MNRMIKNLIDWTIAMFWGSFVAAAIVFAIWAYHKLALIEASL